MDRIKLIFTFPNWLLLVILNANRFFDLKYIHNNKQKLNEINEVNRPEFFFRTFQALIFALLVVSAVALPHRSKKVKSAHVPKHPKVPIVEDHPVEAAAEPLVAVEVAVAVAVEEDPAPAEEEPAADGYHPAKQEPEAPEESAAEEEAAPEEEPAAEEEPVVEEEPAPVKSHPAKKAHKKHYTPKKPAH